MRAISPSILLALLLLSACAGGPVTEGGLTEVAPPADLVQLMRSRVGSDFALGRYPEQAKTLQDVYRFVATEHSARTLVTRWDRVFGAQLAFEMEGHSGPLYVFASNAAFAGDLVYAVAIPYPAFPRTIYVYRAR